MHTYYIERNNKLTGERGISRIDAQSLSMALYTAERMYGSLFTYKSAGSENTPDDHSDPYDNAILRLKPDRQKVYRDRHHRALQNVRRPQ